MLLQMKNKISPLQLEFIFDNAGKMKQVDIARIVGVSPPAINKIIKPKNKGMVVEGYFDIDKEWKQYYKC